VRSGAIISRVAVSLGRVAGKGDRYFERFVRFASLTPAPPPFSGMNSTPGFSRALAIAPIVSSATLIAPPASAGFNVGIDTPAIFDGSLRSSPSISARAHLLM
jgi:hypothetical protein